MFELRRCLLRLHRLEYRPGSSGMCAAALFRFGACLSFYCDEFQRLEVITNLEQHLLWTDATFLERATVRHLLIVAICPNIFTVKSDSFIKDLMEDLPVMDNVCELLNRKPQTNKVLWWKHLGNRFGIDKNTLDVLSSLQEELDCPTEANV